MSASTSSPLANHEVDALFVAEWCGVRGPLNFPANSPTRSREIMTDLASFTFPQRDTWRSRLLNYVDEHATAIVADLAGLVRLPSVSGSDSEIDIQHLLSDRMSTMDLEVDAWQISLDETLAEPDFPGVEVDRSEAWGVVGRVAGRGSGPSLMLNAHVDVVPPGDLFTWEGADPFSGRVTGDTVEGRGACDMKAGLVASLWAVRGLTELKVPLRGDLVLAAVVGEEDGGLGTYALLRRGWRAEACVIPEPTSLDIAPASAGALTFRITVPGAATHASRRLSGVSAIEKFIPIFSALRRLEKERNAIKHPLATRWELPIPIEIGKICRGGLGVERARQAQRRRPDRRRHRRGHPDRPARARGSRRRRLPGRQLASRPPGHRRMVGRSVRIRHHRPRLLHHLDSSTLPR
jgi:Peptidase family M20/M25/M40/Peptidase dimerisation domain